jgi:DNA-binding PadR family transcriptional regulator
MEDVERLHSKHVEGHEPTAKKSAISLKDSAFFEYRWYRILEALHDANEGLSLQGLVQDLKRMGTNPNQALIEEDLLSLKEQEYVECRKENEFPPEKKYGITPLGEEKVKRVLRKL